MIFSPVREKQLIYSESQNDCTNAMPQQMLNAWFRRPEKGDRGAGRLKLGKENFLKTVVLIVSILMLSFGQGLAEELVVRIPGEQGVRDIRDDYNVEMLRMALSKTEKTNGPFRLEVADIPMTQNRLIEALKTGKHIDVMWSMTSLEREQVLLPVRIPLLKGLLGHRIFIIRKERQADFAAIETLDQLRSYTAGQGAGWPDTEILMANSIPVVTSSTYQGLFTMLRKRRFDYFPRGVNEAWAEVRNHAGKGLIVERNLLLHYPAPQYFFVNKKNNKLADRIERGLRLAINDGDFDRLFFNHPIHQDIFRKSRIDQRRIFRIRNPLLSPETPLDEKALWYTP